MAVERIDDVIEALDAIIDRAWNQQSRLGYFAALYRRVTRSVRDGFLAGRFQNGALLERLDVVFANRYLNALERFQGNGQPARSWLVAFEAAQERTPLVLQHLLAGMNAHINLDLGIAAAAAAPGEQLPQLQPDFDQINAVLAEQAGAVEDELAEISPMLALLEKLGLRTETRILNFSLEKARNLAWATAQRLAATPADQLDDAIGRQDLEVGLLGRMIVHPPPPLNAQLLAIRAPESDNIRRILDILAGSGPPAAEA